MLIGNAKVEYGEVFTRRWVVRTILDMVGYTVDQPLASRTLVEPSVGSGAFLGEVIERLIASALRHGVPLANLSPAIQAFDLQPQHVELCIKLAITQLHEAGLELRLAEAVAHSWIQEGDFLLDDQSIDADFVVGNPPYIRSDDLDDAVEAEYRRRWPTMRGRADIYVGFFERSLGFLKQGGKLGFICADRWMRNAYGARLRQLVTDQFAVEATLQMHDVDAFEAEVSAYPAITILARTAQGPAVMVDTTADFDEAAAVQVVSFVRSRDPELLGLNFSAHRLPGWFGGRDLWPSGDPRRIALLEDLNGRFGTLEDQPGTKIGIGVATGADKAFIVHTPADVEADRLLPIVVAADVRSGRFAWGGRHLLNPWDDSGRLVDLDDYPKLGAALRAHPRIKDRFVAMRNPSDWYRTIDKIDSSLTSKPKLLLQDMKATIQPVYEPGGYYPHHNLYYVVSDTWDLQVLGGLLLSRVAQAFIEAYGVKMRGGTLRFQAQYLRKIRVPRPEDLLPDVNDRLTKAFDRRDVDAATRAAEAAYGLPEGTL